MRIEINLENRGNILNTPWNFGISSCHAVLWKRDDLIKHAKLISDKCGFRYVRFHNTISRQMNIYNEDEKGNPIFDFSNFDIVFDNLIESGYIPFFEISFCPDALSDEIHELCYYKANTSLPNSFEKWSYLITEIVKHIIERYGLDLAKKMYFEVWNEPDLPFLDGTMDDYFELYDYTATAIKKVNSDLRVGGPATSKCAWISEFVQHIENGSHITDGAPVPCDFISTHAYPSDLPFLNSADGDVVLQESDVLYDLFSRSKEIIDNSSLKGIPLIIGEWNSSAGPYAYNHDEKNNGAFIIKTCHDLKDIVNGSMYWNMTDIYEESGFHYTPFHGGYGIINVNGVPKSSFHAFSMLNKLKGNEIIPVYYDKEEGIAAISAYDEVEKSLRVLVFYYQEPTKEVAPEKDIDITFMGINQGCVSLDKVMVCNERGSAYEWWRNINSPDYLNLESLWFLNEKSQPKNEKDILRKNKENDSYNLTLSLEAGDFALLTIKNI